MRVIAKVTQAECDSLTDIEVAKDLCEEAYTSAMAALYAAHTAKLIELAEANNEAWVQIAKAHNFTPGPTVGLNKNSLEVVVDVSTKTAH